MRGDIIERQAARSLFGPAAAAGDQPGQAAVGGAIGRPEDHGRGVFRSDLGADDELQAVLLGRHVGADDAGQAVAIGHRQGRVVEFRGTLDQFFRMRSPFEKREVRFGVEFGVGHGRREAVLSTQGGPSETSPTQLPTGIWYSFTRLLCTQGSIKHPVQKPGAGGQAAEDPVAAAGGGLDAVIVAGHAATPRVHGARRRHQPVSIRSGPQRRTIRCCRPAKENGPIDSARQPHGLRQQPQRPGLK